jgi:hypothetical protein
MAAALVAVFSVFLYAVAATGNAHAAGGPVSAPVPAVAGVSGASAGAAGADDSALTSLAPVSSAPSDLTASTEQAANAAAAATQQAARNIVVSIRINSPGNDGPISQTNANEAGAGSANDSATGQGGGSGTGGTAQTGGNQDASTNQAAGSSATADQNDAQNIFISIRVNSPGDNGPITQQNINVAVSSSGNVSVTSQGGGTADPAGTTGGEATGASPSGATGTKRGSLRPMRHAPGSSSTGGGTPAKANGKTHRAPASSGSGSASQPAAAGSTWHSAGPSNPASVPVRVVRHAAVRARASIHTLSIGAGRAAHRLGGVPRSAAAVLGRIATQRRPASLQTADSGGPNVSNAVLLTLVAVLGAFAVLFSSTLMGRASRAFERRTWRLR